MPHVKIQMSFILESTDGIVPYIALTSHPGFDSSLHFLPSKMKPALAGSYRCTCNTGYIHKYTNEVTSHCIDLNECKDSGSTNLTKYGPDGQTD